MSETIENQFPKNARQATFTQVKVTPFIDIIITSNEGDVLGMMSGESLAIATVLKEAAVLSEGETNRGVRKEDGLMPLGQDIYTVTRDFVMGMKSAMLFKSMQELEDLDKSLPKECRYTVVVSW